MRNYKKKTTRGNIPKEIYDRAAKEVIENKRSYRVVGEEFNIIFMSLQRYCKKLEASSKLFLDYN